jgi:hypothetical protein
LEEVRLLFADAFVGVFQVVERILSNVYFTNSLRERLELEEGKDKTGCVSELWTWKPGILP